MVDRKLPNDHFYQFQSSSSFVSGVGVGAVCEGKGCLDNATVSGNKARPRAMFPASSLSSINDRIGEAVAVADVGGTCGDVGASAERMDCDTSERSTDARF